jgi:tetratricopeptide (TPR) repeat protein
MKESTARVIRILFATTVVLLTVLAAPVAAAQTAKFSGTVVDEQGNPVARVRITLEPVDGAGVRASTRTNKKGAYFMGMVQPGNYTLHVEKEGLLFKRIDVRALDEHGAVSFESAGAVSTSEPFKVSVRRRFDIRAELVLGAAVTLAGESGAAETVAEEDALAVVSAAAQQGRCAEVLPRIEELLATPPEHPRESYFHAYCLASLGRFEEALPSAVRACEPDPRPAGAALLRGQVLGELGRIDAAAEWIRLEAESEDEPSTRVQAWIALGVLNRDNDRPGEAIQAFLELLELAPERAESYSELSTLYAALQRPDDAREILERGRAAGAVDAHALLNIGIAYLNNDDYEQAQLSFRQAIALGGSGEDLGMAHALLGRCLMRAGKNREALDCFRESLKLDPGSRLAEETRALIDALERSG